MLLIHHFQLIVLIIHLMLINGVFLSLRIYLMVMQYLNYNDIIHIFLLVFIIEFIILVNGKHGQLMRLMIINLFH